jgi:hypothetical protein
VALVLKTGEDCADAFQQLGWFLDEVYMHKRIHASLGHLTPAEFEELSRCEQLQVALFTKNRSECVQFYGALHWLREKREAGVFTELAELQREA